MSFSALLGNERIKQNLSESLAKGHISHFYLICGPEGSGKRTVSDLLAAAILCQGQDKPCGVCPACRKVFSGNHPDYITVDDPEKKTVPVNLIRQAREDMYIQPNESDRKIYRFPRAQDMGLPGQNALLKVLEEPPAYGVFLLLTDNPEKLLPTVRSRCTLLQMQALPREVLQEALQREFPHAQPEDLAGAIRRSGGFLGQARQLLQEGSQSSPQTQDFVQAYAQRDCALLLQALVPMEKWKRDVFTDTLARWRALLEAALAARAGMEAVSADARRLAAARTGQELCQGIQVLGTALEYAAANVSSGAICGWLVWNLR